MGTVEIFSYSIVRSASEQFKTKTPYVTAIVSDLSGVRFPALIEGYIDGMVVAIGQKVSCQEVAGVKIYNFM